MGVEMLSVRNRREKGFDDQDFEFDSRRDLRQKSNRDRDFDEPGFIRNLLHSTTSALMKLPKMPPLRLVANIPVTRMNKKNTPGGGVKPSLKVSMYPASGSSPRSKNIPARAIVREEGEEEVELRRWRVAL